MAYVGFYPQFKSITTAVSNSGGSVYNTVTNSSNTASSDAVVSATVAGTSAGDAVHRSIVSGATTWSWGVDNSDSDNWVLAASATLGTSNVLTVSTAGVVTFAGTVNNTLAIFAATTSSQLAGVISDETGSGSLVFATSPTLVTPVLGVATATSINKMAITAPASGSTLAVADGKTATISNTLTFTGTDTSSVAFGTGGTVVYTSNKLSVHAATTSSELAGVISDETGSGSLVFATSPTLVTPTLGVAAATSINKMAITAPATSSTLAVADGKTATISNTLTFTGTDTSSVAFGAGGTVVYTSNKLSVHAATTSAELAGVMSDETGSGALVFASSPTLVTPTLGAATATSITFSPTTGGIVGTTTNDSAGAGYVGEYKSNNNSSGLNVAAVGSGTAFDIDSAASVSGGTTTGATGITLGAGDWDISGSGYVNPASGVSGFTQFQLWIGTAAGSSTTGQDVSANYANLYTASNSQEVAHTTPVFRVTLTGNTTYYLKCKLTFSGATTLTVKGLLRARRVR